MEISIRDLVHLIARLTGFEGEIVWDTSNPCPFERCQHFPAAAYWWKLGYYFERTRQDDAQARLAYEAAWRLVKDLGPGKLARNILFRLGLLYYRQREFTLSVEALEHCVAMDPHFRGYNWLGLIYWDHYRNSQRTVEVLEMWYTLHPHADQVPSILSRLTRAHLALNHGERAVELAQQLVESDPRSELWRLLAQAYRLIGEEEKAQRTQLKAGRSCFANDS